MQDAIRSSTALDDQDLDIVNAKDIKLQRHLGNGAFGTVREGTLHYTTVAVKILKEGEVMGALGSLAQAGEADRQDIRRGLVRVSRVGLVLPLIMCNLGLQYCCLGCSPSCF